MKLKNKVIEHFVDKWWDEEFFQKTIKEKIERAPGMWVWNTFGKCMGTSNNYLVIHNYDQMLPWVFTSEEEVREQVKAWDKTIAEYRAKTEKQEEKPKKRSYKKKKKEVKE